eukprot:scaffold55490_cov61-Cyclotella_meneghiniana.AAC.6
MPPDRYCIYMVCCGKLICDGCDVCLTRDRCPFCNAPRCKSYEEYKKKIFERIEKYNDSEAMNNLGRHYYLGQKEFPVDYSKAIELFQRASELGSATAHYNLANAYTLGNGVEKDKKKAMHHWQEAAILGHEIARHNLAVEEGHWELGKVKDDAYQANISLNHYMIAARSGYDGSMEMIEKFFGLGLIPKDLFDDIQRAHKASNDEIKSDQRDRAKASGGQLSVGGLW